MSKERWTKVKVGKNAVVHMRPVSEEIQQQMPPEGSKNFLKHSVIDFLRNELRRLLELPR